MSTQTLTITLPESAMRRVQRVAELTHRSVDEIVLSALNVSLAAPSNLPPALAGELDAMRFFSDDALRAAFQPSMSTADETRLHQLNHLAGEREFTTAEAAEQTALIEIYHRAALRRAQALAVLQQRGLPLPDEPPSAL